MTNRHRIAAVALIALPILLGCTETPGRPWFPKYPETTVRPPPPTLHELAQCPRLDGVFRNESSFNSGGPGLERYFRIERPQLDLRHVSAADPENGPVVPTSETAIRLLDSLENGVRQPYEVDRGERLTIEIRPLEKPMWVRLVVRSSLGRTGEGVGQLDLSRSVDTGNRCKDGVLRGIYGKSGKVDLAWWVDADTGDIVGAYESALKRGEISFRYKRVGP